MVLPYSKETIVDGGLGLTTPASMATIVIGPAVSGTSNVLTWFSSPQSLRAAYPDGTGPLAAEAVIAEAGTVGYIRCAASVAGANSAVTASGGGPTVTIAGACNYDIALKITITKGGALGAGMFQYTLDGVTTTESIVIPTGGTYVLNGTGITVTFASGTYVLAETYSATCTAASCNVSDLTAAWAAITATSTPFRMVEVVTSASTTGSVAALLVAALQSNLDTLATNALYKRGLTSATDASAAAAVTTVSAANAAPRVCVTYGKVTRIADTSRPGYAVPTTQATDLVTARAASLSLSTSLQRVLSGALTKVVTMLHDERATPSGLDDLKVTTLRSWVGRVGAFVSRGWLRSNTGSDVKYLPHGHVLDVACETVHEVLEEQIGRGLRTYTARVAEQNYPGVIDPRDAKPIEQAVNSRLASRLGTPLNAEGVPGHVTGVRYTISGTHNFQTTGVIMGTVRVVPLTYVEATETQIGFATSL